MKNDKHRKYRIIVFGKTNSSFLGPLFGGFYHRHSNSGPPFLLIWSLPRLWYGSLSGSISLNHLSIFYNISCYNSLVLLTFVSRSSCRRHSNSGPHFFLIWSLPRLWYGSLSGSISLNHLSIFYNISCYNSLVLLTFVSRSSCRITYIYIVFLIFGMEKG